MTPSKTARALLESIPAEAVAAAKAACCEQRVAEIIAELGSKGITAVTRLSDDYPALLAQIPYPPPVLFIKGSFEGIFNKGSKLDCLSIVGTRQCTRKGAELAQKIAKELAEAGVTVVSGMARGIDSSAHSGALDGRGKDYCRARLRSGRYLSARKRRYILQDNRERSRYIRASRRALSRTLRTFPRETG